MSRIAIAGFQHETNTFAPLKARYDNFLQGESWPGLTRGEQMFEVLPPMNIASGGFIKEARRLGHELEPILWAAAVPSAHVTEDAYERIAGMIVEGIAALRGRIDAVYLDLHGAMVTEHLEDGEGELLRRVRALVGADLPVVASLDLHANVTVGMVEHASALIAYRTYPHVDMAETGALTARHLHDLLSGRRGRQFKAYRRVPFLLPLTQQCTMVEPSKGIYEKLAALDGGIVSVASYTPGFPPADIQECGPSIFVYADSQEAADRAANGMLEEVLGREADFAVGLMAPADAVSHAMRRANSARRPVVLADVQDNPGAGGTSDTTGLLRALVEAGARGAVLGVLTDPEAARIAHAAGVGAEIELALGGKAYREGDPPLHGRFLVERLSDGRFLCTGPFYGGTRADLGPSALLRIGEVRVVVATRRMQAADQEIFRHLGIEPSEQKILALKSSVHFRAHFTPIAEEILPVEAKGCFVDRPELLPYRNLRTGIRLAPNGPVRSA
ncbi:MAG: M81 family metallopeptidase [Alphaproteobacteria bacterium]|nr:M81 family metallopeptidase [Alphaproteobacteria bacterium]